MRVETEVVIRSIPIIIFKFFTHEFVMLVSTTYLSPLSSLEELIRAIEEKREYRINFLKKEENSGNLVIKTKRGYVIFSQANLNNIYQVDQTETSITIHGESIVQEFKNILKTLKFQ